MKKILTFMLLTISLLITTGVGAEEIIIDGNIVEYKKDISLGEDFKINLTDLKESLGGESIAIEWSLEGQETKTGDIFEQSFDQVGTQEINLNIFDNSGEEKTFVLNSKIEVFVYNKSIPVIFSESIEESEINTLISTANDGGVYIYNMGIYKEKEATDTDFGKILSEYNRYVSEKSDYIGIWGEKEFIFSVLSNINTLRMPSDNKINIVAISSFNTNILKSYLKNFVSNKNSIGNVVIMDEVVRLQVIKNPTSTDDLEEALEKNGHNFLKIQPGNDVSELMFVSKFINNLSNKGFSTSDIYILILLPFLFTLVSFFKHLIGISPMGLIITVLFSVLFFKVGALASTVIMATLLCVNLAIGKLISKQTLLYTPKIGFIVTINIVIFIAVLNILFKYSIVDVNLSDTVYIILFIIVSERLINVIVSKEFKEYKNNLLNTFIIAIAAYLIFSISFLQVFILAYPEIMILLAPANFIMGRFTGLRVTEYLRFKEVIKSIEEE